MHLFWSLLFGMERPLKQKWEVRIVFLFEKVEGIVAREKLVVVARHYSGVEFSNKYLNLGLLWGLLVFR